MSHVRDPIGETIQRSFLGHGPCRPPFRWWLVPAAVGLAQTVLMGGPELRTPSETWQLQDRWRIEIERWRPAPNATGRTLAQGHTPGLQVPARYRANVLVSRRHRLNNSIHWQLDWIIARQDVPKGQREHVGLLVEKNTGWTKQINDAPAEVKLAYREDVAFICGVVAGLPIELFPISNANVDCANGVELVVATSWSSTANVLEAWILDFQGDVVQIRQTWFHGEPWWREYERYVNGEKDLIAKLLDPPKSTNGPGQQKFGKGAASFAVPARKLYALDSRLQITILIQDESPTLGQLLAVLQRESGMTLAVADNLINHEPRVGSIKPDKYLATSLMELIATCDLDEGRWVKTEGGYRLEGTSRALRPPPAPPGTRWGWWLVGGVLGAVGLACGVWWARKVISRRGGKAPSSA